MRNSGRILLVGAVLVLLIFTRLHNGILPLSWPDEALFSSPAAELAEGRPFSTPVLSGLIYGMDRATLWNCPLHMVLLSGVYRITGESEAAGRGFSRFLGAAALLLFFLLARRLAGEAPAGAAAFALSLDPVFLRGANTVRMDMLTLLLILGSVHLALRARDHRNLWIAACSGFLGGLAGISHPFAVIIVPVLFVALLPDLRALITSAAGVAAGFAPWGIYILRNREIFAEQFLPQLHRKVSFLEMLFGGETRGVFHVYFSQYGSYAGSWPAMIAGALLYTAAFVVFVRVLWTHGKRLDDRIRILAAFFLISGFALFSSEGWYVVYGDAFLILGAAAVYRMNDFRLARALLTVCAVVMAGLLGFFTIRHGLLDTSHHAREVRTAMLNAAASCKSVYLRVRPDPYFALKKTGVRPFEFIPGKLRVSPEHAGDLYTAWDGIDCFLIDRNAAWEPMLTEYLARNSKQFRITAIEAPYPLFPADLYRRNP